jgi:hypothetical protein
MSHLSFFILLLISFASFSQKKWDGGGGNNQWNNASNWTGNTVPSLSDDVVLDNSVITSSYSVVLPNTSVTVKSITISPGTSRSIDLTLPATNTSVPGFSANGPGYGMIINSGGIFRNSSGNTSGATVRVLDSIKISNDGRYIHNSASGHSTNVQVLSLAAGTEKGIFELDIPAASSTISISGRTFGKFVLRATAAGGSCNYTAAGTSKVTIRNTLDIGAGVNFNLNASDTISIGADLLQEAGTFNLGNSTRSVVVAVQQNITQNTGGIITESGTGIQTLLINGTGIQLITFKGTISNQVAVVRNAGGMAMFKFPVSLPYKLGLKNGRVVTTQGLITLQASCTVEADSLATNISVDGPLKKDGLANQSFLFPVGKAGVMRWVQLRNATGNFSVEYFPEDPHTISGVAGTEIDHFSSVEYWDVTTSAGATATVKLSFANPYSGGVTNLASLRVARLINGTWEDAGNAGISGSPGSDGWVSSNAASGFSANTKSFALASAMGLENPLPLSSIKLQSVINNGSVCLYWLKQDDLSINRFDVQLSFDGKVFSTMGSYKCYDSIERYSCVMKEEQFDVYYRVVARNGDKEQQYESNVLLLKRKANNNFCIVGSNVVTDVLKIGTNRKANILLVNSAGAIVEGILLAEKSYNGIPINTSRLKPGLYFLVEETSGTTIRFMKL